MNCVPSSWIRIKSGVLQRSVLGSVCFYYMFIGHDFENESEKCNKKSL